jgi:hypothetical protein
MSLSAKTNIELSRIGTKCFFEERGCNFEHFGILDAC